MSPAADRIWLKEYPKGVAADVDVQAYASLADLVEKSCARFHDAPAFENLGTTLSYDDLDRLSQDFAAYLQHVLGLNRGDRVALMMPNLLQYPVAIFGILRAGMVAVNVNPLYTPRELEHQLNDSGARAIVVYEGCAATLQAVKAKTRIEHVITTQLADLAPWPKGAIANFVDRKSTRLNSSHIQKSRMPSSA